jgi:hypothetical protein
MGFYEMPDRVKFSKQDIGGEILPILTTGLYRNKLDALREYIQNSIDARCKKIEVVIDPDTIMVDDDGFGMSFEEARTAIKLGISNKNPKTNVGFRGIGIYSAYNLCNCLDIYTRSQSDKNCNLIHIDFKSARLALIEDQERKKQNMPTSVYLEKLLEDIVYVAVDEENTLTEVGTRAIMSDLRDEVYEELNNWGKVVGYLRDVVPLPFREDFKYASEIQKQLEAAGYNAVTVTLQIGNMREEIRRPYYDGMFEHGGKHPPKFFEISDGKQHYGFAWVCINDARRVLRDTTLRGMLIKKFGFSISDRNYLEPYFARPVFNRRITGEVVIQNENLIPNAARSDFEHNSARQGFIQALPKFIRQLSDWANTIQEEDKARDTLGYVLTNLREINNKLPSIRRDKEALLEVNNYLYYFQHELRPHKATLKRIESSSYEEADTLLNECKELVKSALTEKAEDQEKIEQQVIRSIQREAAELTEAEEETKEDIPKDIIELIQAYGIRLPEEVTELLRLLDDNYLKVTLNRREYTQMIKELKDFLDEQSEI